MATPLVNNWSGIQQLNHFSIDHCTTFDGFSLCSASGIGTGVNACDGTAIGNSTLLANPYDFTSTTAPLSFPLFTEDFTPTVSTGDFDLFGSTQSLDLQSLVSGGSSFNTPDLLNFGPDLTRTSSGSSSAMSPTTTTLQGPLDLSFPASMPPSIPSSSGKSSPTAAPLLPNTERSRVTKPSPELALKRQRNNIAARKYRQKRIDRIEELEAELAAVARERDDLRVELARRDAETKTLREMMGKKDG